LSPPCTTVSRILAGVALATAGTAAVPARDAASTATAAVAIRRIMVPFARDLLTVNWRATVVDEQERRVLRRDQMVGERVALRGPGHESGSFSRSRGFDEPEASGRQGDRLSPDFGDLCFGMCGGS
jgi:hypothetical protein